MNECPTRVRTGSPPCSRTISGTAREVIRLWMTVLPGSVASSRTATSAVIADGETGSPRSSTTKQRSASPSKASPTSAPVARAPRPAGRAGWPAPAGWPRGWGSCRPARSRAGSTVSRQAAVAQDRRHGVAGHPVAGVDDHLQRADPGQVDQAAQILRVRRCSRSRRSTRAAACRPAATVQLLGQRAHLAQAGVLPDRGGAGPAQLDPVVLRRVVAGGEHRAGQAEPAGGEVEQVGGAEPGVHHVRALARWRPRRRRPPAGPTTRACRARSPPGARR